MLFAVRLVDLSAIKALDLTRASSAEIVERLRQVFDFLPKETRIDVTDGIVPEQTAIATILSDMDAEIAALEVTLAKTRQLKQGMMHNLLTGKIRLV